MVTPRDMTLQLDAKYFLKEIQKMKLQWIIKICLHKLHYSATRWIDKQLYFRKRRRELTSRDTLLLKHIDAFARIRGFLLLR